MNRLLRRTITFAATAVVAAALAPLAGATPLTTAAGAAPRVTCADAAAHSDVTVAFVIDFSGVVGAPDNGIVEACVAVPPDDNDSEALSALATEKGFAVPRYSNSGLLCAIAGIPAHGCGQVVKGGYDYWAYWLGSPKGWTYSNTGPAENQVKSSVVQGWRWEDPGHANPSDPQPRGPTTPGPICDPPPPPTTTTTLVRTTVPPSTVAPTSTTSPSPGSEATPTTQGGGSPRATSPTTPGSAAGRGVPATAPSAGQHGSTTSSTKPVRPRTTPPSAASAGSSPEPPATGGPGSKLAASGADTTSHGNGGNPWLLVVLVVLIVGVLGGGAAYRWRRAPPS